jgi:uncharacterized protein YdiU (UPF0061 family)
MAGCTCFRESLTQLGLRTRDDGDEALVQSLLQTMADTGADFTNVFRSLCNVTAAGGESTEEAAVARGACAALACSGTRRAVTQVELSACC